MNRFAELLDRLAYEPGRNNKLRLMTDYFRSTPDPERGFALAALTGVLRAPAQSTPVDYQLAVAALNVADLLRQETQFDQSHAL